ncbi:thymidylate synthase [Candidatus Phytoplasma phoenicium]|uniref:Thymidylate synthase n=1 Tax=Candidatus Phytoplasma phoenicium TaxID=198422 RepID=A0A0L0MJW2_9MOLU|nr:thymidylate synthase [Candidatus Phytoplasma phoenicium]KND62653.1 Thymidylate synthase [Candidatus Phytoplasma phoenicium]
MKQYLDLCRAILQNGVICDNRTKVSAKSIFGFQMRFNLNEGFPMVTTKKLNLKSIIHELLWFIKGDTNIRYLVLNNVKIWNDWPYQAYRKSSFFQGESLSEFVQKIKEDEVFAQKHGNLGPVYGEQWRNFSGIDQLQKIISEIKNNPNSRRLLISSWNPKAIEQMILPPCHVLMQFYVQQNQLSLQLYQRSGDVFLGIPFNIASYSLLLMMVSQVTNLKPYEFIHTLGDAHIYHNHLEQIKIQLQRSSYPLPQIMLNTSIKNIEDFRFTDFHLKNYISHDILNGEIAI